MQLLFGLGIGNVSPAFLPGMEGEYHALYSQFGFGMTAAGDLIWEAGLIGITIYLLIYFFVWRDARRLAKSSTSDRWIGAWWATSMCIFLFGLVYISYIGFNEAIYMLFMWSGFVTARVWQSEKKVEAQVDDKVQRLELAGI